MIFVVVFNYVSLCPKIRMNQLKDAEKKATQLVQDARKGLQLTSENSQKSVVNFPPARVDRMKEAKSEAEQIIAAYRAEMEANYQSQSAKAQHFHWSIS